MRLQRDYRLLPTSSASQSSASISSKSSVSFQKGIIRRVVYLSSGIILLILLATIAPRLLAMYNSSSEEQLIQRRTKLFEKHYQINSHLDMTSPSWQDLIKVLSANLDGSILNTALHLRLFRRLRQLLSDEPQSYTNVHQVYRELEHKLFPWLLKHSSVDDITANVKHERGIVIATGQNYFSMTVHLINSIRLWNCSLPVEVFYLGKNDLSLESVEYLNRLDNVSTVDVGTIFNQTILALEGWDVKPFAILGSSFRQVILVDADVVFVDSPDKFFNLKEYQNSGALFFYDRIFRNRNIDYSAWFKKIIPRPHSKKLVNSFMYRGMTNYEQEAGLVLIDKSRHLIGLLATCLLNCKEERKEIHANTHGEKETYWLGFEIAEEDYEYGEDQAGIIGVGARFIKTGEIILCGHLAHFDKAGTLLWFNDGIVENKRAPELKPGRFRHVESKGQWHGMCLKPQEIKGTPADKHEMLEKMKEIWNNDPLHSQI